MPTLILTGVIALLIFFYFGYRYVIRISSLGVNLLFLAGCFGAISSIFVEGIYKGEVKEFLQDKLTYQVISSLEEKISTVKKVIPGRSESEEDKDQGILWLITWVVRVIVLVLSIACMLLSIYLKYTLTGYESSSELKKRVRKIERYLISTGK
ncbi:MAG: hypothetical protein WBA74_19060 [Cyclobacteriaceae bacterium]